MDDTFKIFVHRLRDGHAEEIRESLPPPFLEVAEKDLSFQVPVVLEGSAEMAEEMLVLRLHIQTEATLPCCVCNEGVQVKISLNDFCHTESLQAIKGAVFDYREVVREAILLEVPVRAECRGGDCPERANLAEYLIPHTNQEN